MYILILTLQYNGDKGNCCSIHSISGFSTYALAETAGSKWRVQDYNREYVVVETSKIEKGFSRGPG